MSDFPTLPEPDSPGLSAVRTYYRALDSHEYDAFTEILHPEFTHYRPDRVLDGRDAFIEFMRHDRPQRQTTHPIDAVYQQLDGDEIIARGRLLDENGSELTGFVDVFAIDYEQITQLVTYTN